MHLLRSRDGSVGLSPDSWATASVSSVTSPGRRRYDNASRDSNSSRHVINYSATSSRTGLEMADRATAGLRLAAGDADDATKRREMTRTAVRPWLLHSSD